MGRKFNTDERATTTSLVNVPGDITYDALVKLEFGKDNISVTPKRPNDFRSIRATREVEKYITKLMQLYKAEANLHGTNPLSYYVNLTRQYVEGRGE